MIRRSEHSTEKHYAIISRQLAQDKRLSFAARGLLTYILSKPPRWEVRDDNLQKEGDIGKTALATIIRNLKDIGYMRRVRLRRKSGRFEYVTEVYEEPQLTEEITVAENQGTVDRDAFSVDGSPVDGESATAIEEVQARAPGPSDSFKDPESKDRESEPLSKPQKPSKYPDKRDWPRYVSLFFAITNIAPLHQLWPEIETKMGSNPDPKKLRACFVEWIGRGYRANNIGWLDWYVDGIPPRQGQQRQPTPPPPSENSGRQLLRKPVNVTQEDWDKQHGINEKRSGED